MRMEGPRYKPSRSEIRQRCEILTWMQVMEWEWAIIDSIMYEDTPSPDTVRRLVYQHGPQEALRLIRLVIYD